MAQSVVLPYGGVAWDPSIQRTGQPFVQPGDPTGGVLGYFRQGFFPAEDGYSPGDSASVRPALPDSPPYFIDRRLTDRLGLASPTAGGSKMPFWGLAAFVGVMLALEHFRPKGR